MLVVVSIMLLFPGTAGAAQRLHGVVLAVTPKTGEAVVRHDAFGGMPSMTMTFRIVPRERAAQLQPGATIDADVNMRTEPWTLSHVESSSAQRLTEDTSPLRRVTILKVGDTVPDTAFLDQRGRPFRFSQLRGQNVVLAFVYTRCQDARMCPLISAQFRRIQQLAGARPLHLVEVTLDPTFDRPPVLARYGQVFGADPSRWSLVVGDAEPTLNFAAQFGITAFPDPTIGLIHAENTVLIDKTGTVRTMITDTAWTPEEIIAQVDAENGIAANPLQRLNLWLSEKAVALCGNSVAGFSGLADLAVVMVIFGAFLYLTYRVARRIIFD
jgi:protein SCO1/2